MKQMQISLSIFILVLLCCESVKLQPVSVIFDAMNF